MTLSLFAARSMTEEGRVTDGEPIYPGDVFRTTTGRVTTPYPKAKKEIAASDWLIANALAEAQSRGDTHNARIFAATKPLRDGSLTPADRDSLLLYTFVWQSKVSKPVLKPLA